MCDRYSRADMYGSRLKRRNRYFWIQRYAQRHSLTLYKRLWSLWRRRVHFFAFIWYPNLNHKKVLFDGRSVNSFQRTYVTFSFYALVGDYFPWRHAHFKRCWIPQYAVLEFIRSWASWSIFRRRRKKLRLSNHFNSGPSCRLAIESKQCRGARIKWIWWSIKIIGLRRDRCYETIRDYTK